MKNIIAYYIAILLPLPLLLLVSRTLHPNWFVVLVLIYAIPYRTLIDGSRLVSKQLMQWNEIWKLLIPGRVRVYRKDLYFKK